MALVGRATGARRGRSGAGGGWLGGQASPWSSQSVTLRAPVDQQIDPELRCGRAAVTVQPMLEARPMTGWVEQLPSLRWRSSASRPACDVKEVHSHKEEVSLTWPGAGPPHGRHARPPWVPGESEWAGPVCAHQAAAPQGHGHGQADVLHVKGMEEVPVHLDDIVLELTEADKSWLTINAIAWSGVVAR
jgi:hypothetical protein